VIPPWVTTATGPGVPGRPTRKACSRAPACRDDSPSGVRSRGRYWCGPIGPGRLGRAGCRSRSRASGWTASPVTNAMRSAVSRARCIGLVYRVCTPRPCSHRPVRLACRQPAGASPGSPGTGSFLAVLHQVGQRHADDPARHQGTMTSLYWSRIRLLALAWSFMLPAGIR